MSYRFQELGWLLFQEVVDAVVARHAGGVEWRGAADVCDRRTTIAAGLALPGLRALPGPTSALVLWRPGSNVWSLIDRGLQHEYAAGSVLFATDDPTGELADEIGVALGSSPVAVLDGPRLAAILDADPAVRRRVPFVLGVRELEGLVDDDVVRRSTLDVEAAHGSRASSSRPAPTARRSTCWSATRSRWSAGRRRWARRRSPAPSRWRG